MEAVAEVVPLVPLVDVVEIFVVQVGHFGSLFALYIVGYKNAAPAPHGPLPVSFVGQGVVVGLQWLLAVVES